MTDTAPALTPERFLERFGRYFNRPRLEAIANLGFLFVEGRAEGVYFDDAQGRRLLDMWGMGGTFSLGHRHPAVVAAAEAALRAEDFGSLFFFSEAKGLLAEKLAQCTPRRLETTHSVVTGGEAIDLAIKLARGSTRRSAVLHADHAYHGCTGFALSMRCRAGMMFALDFADAGAGMAFLGHMFALGVLVVASSQRLDIVKLYPPLILEPEQVAEFSEKKMKTALRSLA